MIRLSTMQLIFRLGLDWIESDNLPSNANKNKIGINKFKVGNYFLDKNFPFCLATKIFSSSVVVVISHINQNL